MEVEYVYALHDFEPQNDDEIAFVAGERIEVLEKDEAYGDGWWTGRNLAGQEGIFPKDYTTPAGPLIPDLGTSTSGSSSSGPGPTNGYYHPGYGSVLHPLTEENESETNGTRASSPPGQLSVNVNAHSNNSGKPNINVNVGKNGKGGGGQVMAATMTDIQSAIDALGVRRTNTDDGGSISFASTRDDHTSMDDHEHNSMRDSMYDDGEVMTPNAGEFGAAAGGTSGGTFGGRDRTTMNENWHRDARRRLFERVGEMDAARRAAEQQEFEEHRRSGYHHGPVEVELSDESEDEDGHHTHGQHYYHNNQPPNDLLSRLKPHEDSIPSTLPETFEGNAASLLDEKEKLAESPAIADDSPTLAQHPHRPDRSEEPSDRAPTPVQHPPPVESTTPPATTQSKIEKKKEGNENQYFPVPVASSFAPSPFSVSTVSPPATANKISSADNYPITSAALYSSATASDAKPDSAAAMATVAATSATPTQKVEQRRVEGKGGEKHRPVELNDTRQLPQGSSSYISFLPSPTTANFKTTPSASGSGELPLNAQGTEGISQVLAQNQSQGSMTAIERSPTPHSVSKPTPEITTPNITANASTSNLSTTVPSIQGIDSSFTSAPLPNGNASVISSTSLVPPSVSSAQTSPKKKIPPAEWTVDQVVDWIRSKGFDEATCGKFREHEISGDVLLEFDAAMLKEIDIVAFGKRVKIANAIQELRRPPSFESSDNGSLKTGQSLGASLSGFSGVGVGSTMSSAPQSANTHGFGMSALGGVYGSVSMPHIGQSQPSTLPGGGHGYSTSQSTQGYNASLSSAGASMPSPNIFGMLSQQQASSPQPQTQTLQQNVAGSANGYSQSPYVMLSPRGHTHQRDLPNSSNEHRNSHVRVDSDPGVNAMGEAGRMLANTALGGFDKAATVGHTGMKGKSRPVSLALSPSDNNLSQRSLAPVVMEEEDRAALSDSDLRRRKKEIKSLDTATTHEPPDTPGSRSDTPSRASGRIRSSLDTKSGDRLSFFSAMGRSRKPAPRYSSDHSGSEMGSPNVTQDQKQKTYSKLYLAGPSRPSRVGKSKEDKEKEKKEKAEAMRAKRDSKERDRMQESTGASGVLRKRTLSGDDRRPNTQTSGGLATPLSVGGRGVTSGAVTLKPGEDVLKQLREIVGEADHSGFMLKKGERYNTWKNRFFFLKGPHLYYLRSKQETRIKGYINIHGYKVIADETTAPGKYGFRIVHDTQKPHFFSSEEQPVIRDWMKALMKATIDRDYTRPIVSSCNIPTIPLTVAQAMNPAPRPPSPTAVAAAQRASRQGDANGLSTRDAKVLIGIAEGSAVIGQTPQSTAPARPSREMRRPSVVNRSDGPKGGSNAALLQWINSQLPDQTPYATDLSMSLSSGLILYRLAESIKYGQEFATARLQDPPPDDPVVPDSLFEDNEERVEGLMKLFDFLLDNDVKLSGISMADIKEGRSEKIIALIKSMKTWKEQRDAIAKSVAVGGQAGILTWIHG